MTNQPNQRFQNKVCMVTGGGSGIGKATARRLASEGAKVAVIDLNADHGFATAKEINGSGGEAFFIHTDIGQPDQIKLCVLQVVDKWNKIDVLVNNAALMTFASVTDLHDEDWDRVMAVNLRSVFLFCKYSLPHMVKGAIVNVSSVHAHETTVNCAPYAASKGGVEAFTRALSRELEGTGTRVNAVAPGAVNTPMLWSNPNVKSGKEKIQGAVGQPEDLAAAICFLASGDAAFVQGTTLVVDGGRLDIL